MKYYETNKGFLISHNDKKDLYLHRNTLKKDKRISKEEFESYHTKTVKNQTFFRKLSVFFKDVEVSWEFKPFWDVKPSIFCTEAFTKTNNLKGINISKKSKYFEDAGKYGKCPLVYHQGKVVIFVWIANASGYSGMLLDINTKKVLKWTDLKNYSVIIKLNAV